MTIIRKRLLERQCSEIHWMTRITYKMGNASVEDLGIDHQNVTSLRSLGAVLIQATNNAGLVQVE